MLRVVVLARHSLQPAELLTRASQTSPAKMSAMCLTGSSEDGLLHEVRATIPPLTNAMHKGQAGKIAVLGGSRDYTGAPYFTAMSAMKVGCDLIHVFCPESAAQVIKSYSPELMVHPLLDLEGTEAVSGVLDWLDRLNVIVLGPGLGRSTAIFTLLGNLLDELRQLETPIIVDADALYYVTQHPEKIHGNTHAILTPNAMEFSRLCKEVLGEDVKLTPSASPEKVKELATALGHVTVVHKGASDVISNGRLVVCCTGSGSPRRCGGQGDLLAGAMATFYHWALNNRDRSMPTPSPQILAAYGACRLTRECGRLAFSQHGRSTTTTDMVRLIHQAFSFLYGP